MLEATRRAVAPVPSPFSVRPLLARGRRPGLMAAVTASAVERALALPHLDSLYHRAATISRIERPFADAALETLGVEVDVQPADLAAVPPTGPLVVVANHPFGGVDGLVLLSVLNRVRGDVRVLGNDLMRRIPELQNSAFFVNPFGGRQASRQNAAALRRALAWLRDGHALAVFPAGEVSHLTLMRRVVTDPHWHPTAAWLARAASAPVMPIYFHGANSRWFQVAGLVHPALRTLLLPREVLKRRGTVVKASVGGALAPTAAKQFDGDEAVTQYLRARTYVQRGRQQGATPNRPACHLPAAIAPAASSADLRGEVGRLRAGQRLLENGDLSVWVTTQAAAPRLVGEIGRLRELTFREVGEGTGRPYDIDRFDSHYLHVFVWNERAGEVVGAYRAGQTDEILSRFGTRGLYTSTLFHFHRAFIPRISPALELGRSFVRPEYQRQFAPLMLLWKGIGQLIVTDPRYSCLFGAVSISREYASMSQQLMMMFLRQHRLDPELSRLVRPRTPPATPRRLADLPDLGRVLAGDVDRVEDLVREIERGQRGVPVLMRQYLKLGAKVLAFNVDPEFGDVLDALVVVDLRAVDSVILQKYMGRAGAARFVDYHERRPGPPPPANRPAPGTPALAPA